jgi:hypothetical protein
MTTAVAKANKGKVGGTQLSSLLSELVEARQHVVHLLERVDEVLAGESIRSEKQARPSPLDHVKEVMAATEGLRVANGNLSAERIAKLYGISTSQLSDWLGRTRQAVAKTPDADSLQEALGYFERVARLTAVMSADGFRKWLRMPHADVAAKNPLELMAKGEWQAVADFVDDMLTGTPG